MFFFLINNALFHVIYYKIYIIHIYDVYICMFVCMYIYTSTHYAVQKLLMNLHKQLIV